MIRSSCDTDSGADGARLVISEVDRELNRRDPEILLDSERSEDEDTE